MEDMVARPEAADLAAMVVEQDPKLHKLLVVNSHPAVVHLVGVQSEFVPHRLLEDTHQVVLPHQISASANSEPTINVLSGLLDPKAFLECLVAMLSMDWMVFLG